MLELSKILSLPMEVRNDFAEYALNSVIINEEGFQQKVAMQFLPPKGQSFADRHYGMLDLWDTEKNEPFTPERVHAHTADKYYFKCAAGRHESFPLALFNVRNVIRSRNKGCPICAGKIIIPTESFGAKYPQKAKDWHYELNGGVSPFTVAPRSGKSFWFRCGDCGDNYLTSLSNRAITNGHGCRSNKRNKRK
jgi:hypothetical protein